MVDRVTVIPCGPAVNESERRAIERLKAGLIGHGGDDVWVLLTNLTLSTTHRLQSDEIDIVAIGPPGVRVIEVKHWSAAWVRKNGDRVAQEADRVTNKAKKVGTMLRAKMEHLPHVAGVFLVTEDATKVQRLPEVVRGVRFHTFKTWRGAVGADASVLTAQQIGAASRMLEPRSAVSLDGELRRLGGYARLELQTDPTERFHRIYRGIHATRQERVLLHLYDLSDLSAGDVSNAEQRARRGFAAINRLQQYDWAPRIVDSFQDAPGYPEEMKFFTVADPAAPSIVDRAEDDSWSLEARFSFARDAVRAVRELHAATADDEPMLHRNLTPRTVLVRHDNSPILTGFEYARIPTEVTVASAGSNAEWDESVAPEVRSQGRGAADRRSDVYSLCASLRALFAGGDDSHAVIRILDGGTAQEPPARAELPNLDRELSALLGESVPPPPPPPARFWTEDQVVRFAGSDYRIVARLGSGGVGTTFKVVEIDRDTKEDLGTYVAKVVHDQATGERVLRAHRLVRSHLHRSSWLSMIYQVDSQWRDNGFAALLTWIEGDSLAGFAGLLSELAEDSQEASDEALALRWLRAACAALGELHRNGLVHGDVSPRNLILSGADVVLTDYDCVTRVDQPLATPGTVPYCSSSCQEGLPAAPSDDLYALAASIFFVLFAKEPFRYQGVCAKERGLNWEDIPREQYPVLAEFLDRATATDRSRRYATATEALSALDSAHGEGRSVSREQDGTQETEGSEPLERHENEVEWLKSLLQSYPGSRWGNRETRGLDTDFAARTYVETALERTLYDDLRARRISLVVLCGNAGDGKTAILQRLAKRLGLGDHRSAARIVNGQTDDGLTLRMNLDGSAAWEGRSAHRLLNEILEPFQHGRPGEDCAHLLAINDGRLLEWIDDAERDHDDGRTALTHALADFLEDRGQPDSHVRFVNLNQRSLVGGIAADGIDTGFLNDLVDRLYGGERAAATWAPCRTCSAQDRCAVFRAARTFGPGGLADDDVRTRARQRLFEALQAVHLRGETHVTVRELRAALVYILFGLQYCSDYHAAGQDEALPYWDRAFDAGSPGRQGDVLRELIRFDPALDAHPHIDRVLLHPPEDAGHSSAPRRSDEPAHGERHTQLASERRRAYFEWTAEEIAQVAGDPEALGLAQGRHLREFRDMAIADDAARGKLARRLCGGISRLEALPPQALDLRDAVPLRITPRTPIETAFWVEKSPAAFRLEPEIPASCDLDLLHRQAVLLYRYHDGRKERLRLGYDLFSLLLEMEEGYQLGDVATDDIFAQLAIFVQRLVREDERRMMAWNPMSEDTIYELSADLDDDAAGGPRQLLRIDLRNKDSADAE